MICGLSLQYEAALAVDSVKLITIALNQLWNTNRKMFREVIRGGKFYNNNTEGIDCDSEPVQPWKYGQEIMKIMRNVSPNSFLILL